MLRRRLEIKLIQIKNIVMTDFLGYLIIMFLNWNHFLKLTVTQKKLNPQIFKLNLKITK